MILVVRITYSIRPRGVRRFVPPGRGDIHPVASPKGHFALLGVPFPAVRVRAAQP